MAEHAERVSSGFPTAFEGQFGSTFAAMGQQWVEFIKRRLEQDVALADRLAHCTRPDELWTAYSSFWAKAADDYMKEAATFAELAGGVAAAGQPRGARAANGLRTRSQ